MPYDILAALVLFALASSITPGPNTLMVMASSANFGLRRSLPHMTGIAAGVPAMILLVGAGATQVLAALPWLDPALRAVCLGILLWLAWKIARADAPGRAATQARPLSFLRAAAFQWVNPKAWAMALTAITVYAPDRSLGAVVAVALVFGAVNLPSTTLWALMGRHLRNWLLGHGRGPIFNAATAALLVASALPLL